MGLIALIEDKEHVLIRLLVDFAGNNNWIYNYMEADSITHNSFNILIIFEYLSWTFRQLDIFDGAGGDNGSNGRIQTSSEQMLVSFLNIYSSTI